MNALTVRPMIYKEARECADTINTNMNDVRHLVLELYEREGWAALGYKTWRECVTAEFKQGERHLYEQLEAAQTERNICAIAQNIPESQLRPLTKLRNEPEKQREAWQQAVATAPDGKVTAAHVYKIVKGMTNQEPGKTEPETEEESDSLFHLKRWWKRATKKDRKIFLHWTEMEEGNDQTRG